MEEIISIANYNGNNWVRVNTAGEDFCLGIHDLDVDGKTADLTKPQIQEALKEQGYAELTKKQGLLVCALLDEINDMMKKAGGEPFANDWYACADYNSYCTWCFNGTYGCFNTYDRYYGHFRCRPVIPYAQLERRRGMKVQELFIGAWVRLNDPIGAQSGPLRVCGIEPNRYISIATPDGQFYGLSPIDDIEPIPLTMEILENNELIHISEYDDDIPCLGYFSIDARNGGFKIDINSNSVRVSYVHQLQALFNLAGFDKGIIIITL